MTHRALSKNSASSRAIPWPKMMERISIDPVVPIVWPAEQKGMQGGSEIPPLLQEMAKRIWIQARNAAVMYAEQLHNIGKTYNQEVMRQAGVSEIGNIPIDSRVKMEEWNDIKIHKSIPNRMTEPWMWITIVMIATDWKNLYRLRMHPDAEPHFQELMRHINVAMEGSTPQILDFGSWHTPYFDDAEWPDLVKYISANDLTKRAKELKLEVSVARVSRVSYENQDGKRDFGKDIEQFNRLVQGSGFGHWSPHEHVAMSSTRDERSGNFRGWKQYRKLFVNENADA